MVAGKRQHGFTLIEALVAVLILSIGLLGAAAMQLKALQSAHLGYQRAVASLAAQDAVERLWSKFDPERGECAELGGEQGDWEAAWLEFLPELRGTLETSGAECTFRIALVWADSRLEEGETHFSYRVSLPGSGP